MGDRGRPILAATAAVLCLAAVPPGPAADRAAKWDIQVTVSADGQYELSSADGRYDGSYAFTAQWVGLMERDDQDFLLIHKSVHLEKWKAEEKASPPGQAAFLQTEDFSEKPELRVNYVLRKTDGLHVAFFVQGFEVPRSESADSFFLVLPASAENQPPGADISYGAYVSEGSNRVVLDPEAMTAGTEVKKFSWTWKYRSWVLKQNRTVFISNVHKAVVTASATPHQERPGG